MSVRSVLCPVDFSECSEHALRYALTLAQSLGAEIRLLHVYQPLATRGPQRSHAEERADADARHWAKQELEALAHRYSAHDVTVVPLFVEGLPHERIVELAKSEGADLIVMGTHGRSALPHFLLGSVAERVVRISTVPVCTIRLSREAK
jgi:nucleotide-binding universal stress UspA family protein